MLELKKSAPALLIAAALPLSAQATTTMIGPGADIGDATNRDTPGQDRLNVDTSTSVNLSAGTYEISNWQLNVFDHTQGNSQSGTITPMLLSGTPGNYTAVWIGSDYDPTANGVQKVFEPESFTLGSATDIYAGYFTKGSGAAIIALDANNSDPGNNSTTNHDNTPAPPASVGDPVSGFSHTLARTYAFEINLGTNLISNGSFESGGTATVINGNNLNVAPDNWLKTAGAGWNMIRVDGTGYSAGPDSAADGQQFIDLNGAGEIFQTFTLTEASEIDFGAWFSKRENGAGSSASTVGIYDETGTTLLSTLASVDLGSETAPSSEWTLGQDSVDLAAGTYQVHIDLSNDQNVDSVFVYAVPEPGSLALLGLGTLLIARRRRSTD